MLKYAMLLGLMLWSCADTQPGLEADDAPCPPAPSTQRAESPNDQITVTWMDNGIQRTFRYGEDAAEAEPFSLQNYMEDELRPAGTNPEEFTLNLVCAVWNADTAQLESAPDRVLSERFTWEQFTRGQGQLTAHFTREDVERISAGANTCYASVSLGCHSGNLGDRAGGGTCFVNAAPSYNEDDGGRDGITLIGEMTIVEDPYAEVQQLQHPAHIWRDIEAIPPREEYRPAFYAPCSGLLSPNRE